MANYNKIILIGHLTKDPKMIETKSALICNCSIAVNGYSDKQEPLFVDFTAFNKTAEIIGLYCKKGNPLMIEGKLALKTWTQNGEKKYKHEVIVEKIQLLNSKEDEEDRDKRANEQMYGGNKKNSAPSDDDFTEDDVPF